MNKLPFTGITEFVNAVREKGVISLECKCNEFVSYGKKHQCKLTVGNIYEAIVSTKDKDHYILFNDDGALQEYPMKFFKRK